MDTRIVEVRRNIMISRTLAGQSSFSVTINKVEFIPDEVIVKCVIFTGTDPTLTASVYTDMVSDYICSFGDPCFVSPNITYSLRKPIIGQYSFQLFDSSGAPKNATGGLHIQLEFVKYRQ